ncbi:MAG: hypothetical protein R6X32_16895, partial [Chloroflexota bacterium]
AFRANDVIERFGEHLHHHLKPDGQVLLLLSSEGDETYFLNLFRQHGYQIEVAAQRPLPTETLTLYTLCWVTAQT